MTVEQLIARLQELVADPESGITAETELWLEHPDGGSSEVVEQVYRHPRGRFLVETSEGETYEAGPYDNIALISSCVPQ